MVKVYRISKQIYLNNITRGGNLSFKIF